MTTVASRPAIVPALVDSTDEKAAAALVHALETEPTPSPSPPSTQNFQLAADPSRFIVTSPYPDHLLDLETLDPQTQLLTRALAVFDKVRDDYATAPYVESFNFSAVIDELRRLRSIESQSSAWTKRDYFVVAFRSQIPPTTNYGDLSSLDKDAHREATDSGGLLRYWFHLPDADGRNLATCLWRTPGDAHKAGHGPQHRKASSSVRSLYREWRIERYRLVIDDDVKSWKVIEWKD